MDANPKYAHVQYPDGRETTVSLKDLAPQGLEPNDSEIAEENVVPSEPSEIVVEEEPLVRRSSRTTKGVPPECLGISGDD